MFYNAWALKFKRLFRNQRLGLAAIKLLNFFGLITYNYNPQNCKVRRAVVLWQEAEKRSIEMKEILLLKRPIDVYIATKQILDGKHSILFSGLPRPKDYDTANLDLMDDKAWLKKIFQTGNLPVPMGGSAWNFFQAKRIFNRIQKLKSEVVSENPDQFVKFCHKLLPVIVKPRAGSRGRHSTTFVFSLQKLEKAYLVAKQLCFWVMVEEQLTGPVYRATVINYELCGVLRGDSPQVMGDGMHNVAQLIAIKNSHKKTGVEDISLTLGIREFLAKQDLSLSYVPEVGESVLLSEKIGVRYGGSSSEDFDICHPDNKDLFTRAARLVGDPIVGFDFIIPDITKSWRSQKCGFIEANSLPFINLHHDPLNGPSRNVAAKVWCMLGW